MRVRRIMALTALVAAMTVTGTAAAEPARPRVLGVLATYAPYGTADAAPRFRTMAPCPTGSDGYDVVVNGPGLTNAVAAPRTDVGVSTTRTFDAVLTSTFRDIAAAHGTALEVSRYTVSARCLDLFTGGVLGVFRVDVVFTTPTRWRPAPTAPTLAMAITPGDVVAEGTPVTLSAVVSPTGMYGTVEFLDGTTPISAPMPYPGGNYTVTTSALTPGLHTLTTRFTSTFASDGPGASTSLILQVVAVGGVTAGQNITTEVLAGELLISLAPQGVVLPAPVMSPDGSLLTTSGSLNPITVTDTRAGNPGWTISGQVSDFTSGSNRINGANLGWVPGLLSAAAAQTIQVGSAIPPAAAIGPGQVPAAGSGLTSARTLATGAAGRGNGTATVTALLVLNVPTSTVEGTYAATLTLTAI
ncbi:Ig-like domain-containing protein [Actinokineospora globicatena]|uniref:Bacterial Ig-like domain-containing protein n=1 Tax=Actinokineospora globicatena TaxID=103729 RepID=A0A9W6QPA2_9PSEU|nr:Ig-like domain-containing protein [Actinokineospora globicatena]GLW93656.1 hypothetical protein Aglo03_44720 [Actinokineospora globicatena]